MFSVYFSVCLRAIIARLVPDRDKGESILIFSCFGKLRVFFFVSGKAFSFVAMVQNLDVVIGTIACVEIYRASLDVFIGLVFVFAVVTRVIALLLIL